MVPKPLDDSLIEWNEKNMTFDYFSTCEATKELLKWVMSHPSSRFHEGGEDAFHRALIGPAPFPTLTATVATVSLLSPPTSFAPTHTTTHTTSEFYDAPMSPSTPPSSPPPIPSDASQAVLATSQETEEVQEEVQKVEEESLESTEPPEPMESEQDKFIPPAKSKKVKTRCNCGEEYPIRLKMGSVMLSWCPECRASRYHCGNLGGYIATGFFTRANATESVWTVHGFQHVLEKAREIAKKQGRTLIPKKFRKFEDQWKELEDILGATIEDMEECKSIMYEKHPEFLSKKDKKCCESRKTKKAVKRTDKRPRDEDDDADDADEIRESSQKESLRDNL
jgi:hypothetical protein